MALRVRRPEDGPGQADDPKGGVAIDLELENQRLHKAVSDLTLDKPILAETVRAPGLPCARTAPLNAAQAAERP